jgi:hypothetical protein
MRLDVQEQSWHPSAPERLSRLERMWCEANAEVIRAQRNYEAVLSEDDCGITAQDHAWLRLWRAQQREREIAETLAREEV